MAWTTTFPATNDLRWFRWQGIGADDTPRVVRVGGALSNPVVDFNPFGGRSAADGPVAQADLDKIATDNTWTYEFSDTALDDVS